MQQKYLGFQDARKKCTFYRGYICSVSGSPSILQSPYLLCSAKKAYIILYLEIVGAITLAQKSFAFHKVCQNFLPDLQQTLYSGQLGNLFYMNMKLVSIKH